MQKKLNDSQYVFIEEIEVLNYLPMSLVISASNTSCHIAWSLVILVALQKQHLGELLMSRLLLLSLSCCRRHCCCPDCYLLLLPWLLSLFLSRGYMVCGCVYCCSCLFLSLLYLYFRRQLPICELVAVFFYTTPVFVAVTS